MNIKLIDPCGGKNYSVQFFHCSENEMKKIKIFYAVNNTDFNIFLQGFSNDWAMIEFWTHDIQQIINFCELVEENFGKVEGL